MYLNCQSVLNLSLGVLKQVIEASVPGASVREICEFGDYLLLEETSKVFKKEKELRKGTNYSQYSSNGFIFELIFCLH